MSIDEEKKFVMKNDFTNLSGVANGETMNGKEENHFGISWRISGQGNYSGWGVYLECLNPSYSDDWLIKTKIVCGHVDLSFTFNNKNRKHLVFWCTSDSRLPNVEMAVKINEIKGIKLKKRDFNDESAKKYSDVVLKIKNEKFYVLKQFLASHSTYFQSIFFGNFGESKRSEIELKDINPQDFQNFLELIYGETLVKESTVEGILHLADYFDSKTAHRRCEKFLLKSSEKKLKQKFELANKYKLDKLMEKCLSEIKTKAELRSITPSNSEEFSHDLWKKLFEKSLTVQN